MFAKVSIVSNCTKIFLDLYYLFVFTCLPLPSCSKPEIKIIYAMRSVQWKSKKRYWTLVCFHMHIVMVVSIYTVKRKIFLFFLLFPGKSKYKVKCGNLFNCREVFKAILCFARINFKGFFCLFQWLWRMFKLYSLKVTI